MMARNTARVMISIPLEVDVAVREVAEEEDRSYSSVIRLALSAWFAERNRAKS